VTPRAHKALLALAVGAFALGTTEFLMMGLLPQVAADVGVSIPTAGYIISSYAVGVVLGAPTLTALSVRYPRKHVLLGLMALFTAGHVAIALAPGYGALVAARCATGLAHGAFFGVGAVVARSVVPPQRAARAISLMFVGLTVANIVGVPLGTALGQVVSWRWAFGVVAACGLLTMLAVAAWVPRTQEAPPSLREELVAFTLPQVLLALATTTIGTGALFAVYSYVAPILTDVSGFSSGAVVWVLVAYGVGTTAGTLLGGHLGDRFPAGSVVAALAGLAAVLAVLTGTSGSEVGAVVTLVVFGVVAFSMGPVLQNRVMSASGGAAMLVSAGNQAAFNAANALGAFLGAQALHAGYGYRGTMVVGIALALAGVGLAVVSALLERSGRLPVARAVAVPARPRPAPGPASEAASAPTASVPVGAGR
jgi:MFS transporter, DHA1 family, inner membrane transport protein